MSELRSVQQADPGAAYRSHCAEIDTAMARVLRSGRYILDEEVLSFERAFAGYLGAAHGIGVGNGTDALELALRACGVVRDDLVFMPSFAPSATAAAVDRCGARVVLVDVDAATLTIDPNALQDSIAACMRNRANGAKLAAIVPVHLFGCPADMTAVLDIAERLQLSVIEDCCQAHGASMGGRRVGTFGQAAAFSFYPTKNLGCFGDGGMVVTNDAAIAERVRKLRQYGWRERYISDSLGVNSRLDELQAAILSALLPHLDERNDRRRRIATAYARAAEHAPLALQACSEHCVHVFHQFVVRTTMRAELQAWFEQRGIATAIHYPAPLHRQPAFAHDAIVPFELTESERVAAQILSLPMFPELPADSEARVTACLREWTASIAIAPAV